LIHLKLHTEYHFGQTYAKIDRVIQRLKDIGCTAAGIVDSSTWGHIPWHKACVAAGIQPILGVELIVSDENEQTKMWFLAKNQEGLKELYNFNSNAYHNTITNQYQQKLPRLYTHDVVEISKTNNIVIFAGDILDGEFLKEVEAVVDLNPSSLILNAKKKALASKYNLRIVETSDNAFCYEEDEEPFAIISKAGRKMTKQHILEELKFQEQAEMIALQCPMFNLRKAPMIHEEGDLEALCREGIKYRKMEGIWNEVYEDRLKYELDLIASKSFTSYFIIVSDMVRYAKQHMLVGPSRGSSAGSLVCYLARITEIDPIPPGLYFERFIDVSREDLPDIDLDFPDKKRHIVFEYMEKKYGTSNVAHIGTISVYKPKSALITTCKALDIPSAMIYNVKTAMIERSIADARATNCLEDTLTGTDPGREFIKMYPDAIIATKLEGHASHVGVHAAGLLICNDMITNYATVDAEGIAHCDKHAAESLNLLKIDVLGLRTLSVIEDTGINIDWYNLPVDDPEVLSMFGSGRLCGLFQFEGNAMRSLAKLVEFKSIAEVDNVTALARPGPYGAGIVYDYVDRKNGKPYTALHPLVEECMRETCGLPLYQEQTFAIVRNIGKFNWEETTFIRKGISKRMGTEFFEKFIPRFIAGAATLGIPEAEAMKTWKLINAMGSWQMNKAHTYSYAVISYWCAYLKKYHLLEFAASTLRNAKDDDSALELLRELGREGVQFTPFDIEKSEETWCVKDGMLLGGFTALIGIGDSNATKFVALRNEGKLSAKDREKILAKKSKFDDIFPFHNNYGHIYANPKKYNVDCDKVSDICEFEEGMRHGCERVFIAELVHKNPRDINEEMFVKRRGGKIEGAPFAFIDLKFRDDTELIGARIGRFDFERCGRTLMDTVPVGAHLLVRAKFWNGIRYAFVTKWKWLNKPEGEVKTKTKDGENE
jgi:DNA-directed DNA polymerase III PolC